jgi:DNA-binding transcriptional ArsR family regulator
MRAMAHPARLALLEKLGSGGPATATECASVVGLSPSAVSYHLRALARAGLVEEAPGRGDGRERLWRRRADRYRITIDLPPNSEPEALEARQELMESLLSRDAAKVRRYVEHVDDEPEEWKDGAQFTSSVLLLTAAELKALSDGIEELIAPYRQRSRSDPPAGARSVSAMIRMLPG